MRGCRERLLKLPADCASALRGETEKAKVFNLDRKRGGEGAKMKAWKAVNTVTSLKVGQKFYLCTALELGVLMKLVGDWFKIDNEFWHIHVQYIRNRYGREEVEKYSLNIPNCLCCGRTREMPYR